jgi:uroporphyrinogen-III synthase
MTEPRLLVTRFAPHAQQLAKQLNSQRIFAIAQPLLAVEKSTEFDHAHFVFRQKYDYIIAVSCNAVNYSAQALGENRWPVSRYLAVGKATQAKLQEATGLQVIVPEQQFSSEGLLALPCLADMQDKRVLILRGVGGRELLAEALTARGAIVDYYQPYQRIAVELSGALIVKQWQQQYINGAIISSVALLQRLLEIVPAGESQWLKALTLYVPSRRIAEHAQLAGWHHVELLPGMQEQQIVDYFK